MQRQQLRDLHACASRHLVTGVGASARLNPALGHPLYLSSANGARIVPIGGGQLIDFNMSLGAALLGHNEPNVRAAIESVLDAGVLCSHETQDHGSVAAKLCEIVPSAELVRFANTGAEANQVAVRLARAVTGRSAILKFEGHFHGLNDYWMFNTTSRPAESEDWPFVALMPESAGIPDSIRGEVLVVPWNDERALVAAFERRGADLAAVLCEPVNYNAGCIPPEPGFLQTLRALCSDLGVVLIFDEILSGFRMNPGGAQAHYGVTPDLTSLGKALGNGTPVSALVGSRAIMEALAPIGTVAQSGTYTGHPLAMAAANVALDRLRDPNLHARLDQSCGRLCAGLADIFDRHRIRARIQRLGARFGVYFGIDQPVTSTRDCRSYDVEAAADFARRTYAAGLYFHSYGRIALGHHGISAAHSEADLDEALDRIDGALEGMQ